VTHEAKLFLHEQGIGYRSERRVIKQNVFDHSSSDECVKRGPKGVGQPDSCAVIFDLTYVNEVDRRGQRIRDIKEDGHFLLVCHGGTLESQTEATTNARLEPRGEAKMVQIQNVGRDLGSWIEALSSAIAHNLTIRGSDLGRTGVG
jgi:hypothetical protein